jgi:hypothetical protein
LERFLSAWSLAGTASEIALIGDCRSGYREDLLAQISPKRRELIRFIPAVKPAELPATLAGFDVGLALEERSPRNKDLTISNKVFQYLNAGLAVIASETAGQGEIFAAAPGSGILISAGDDGAFAETLDRFLGNPTEVRTAQREARAAAEREFCWEKESPRLLDAVARALAAPAPRKHAPRPDHQSALSASECARPSARAHEPALFSREWLGARNPRRRTQVRPGSHGSAARRHRAAGHRDSSRRGLVRELEPPDRNR